MNWLKRFVADLNTTSFGSVANQFLWVIGSLALTATACALMLRRAQPIAIVPGMDAGASAMAATVAATAAAGVESARQIGKEIAYALLFAWTGKSVVSAAKDAVKRNTDIDYQRAKNEGPAKVEVANVEQVTVTDDTAAAVTASAKGAIPVAGMDSRTDDERRD